jgi:hypothetical protein
MRRKPSLKPSPGGDGDVVVAVDAAAAEAVVVAVDAAAAGVAEAAPAKAGST